MKRLSGILIFSTFLLTHLYAQHQNFTTLSIEEGLSQSVVNCMFQDSKGYIWLGTQNGLDRFDGQDFVLYRFNPADSNSISNNWIYAISEDHEGNLWIGTKGGLHKFVRDEDRFERIQYQSSYHYDVGNYSYDNICLRNGKILIHTPPLISIVDPADNSFSHYTSRFAYDASVKDVKIPVLEDYSGNIWVANSMGLAKFLPASEEFIYCTFESEGEILSEKNVTALFQDQTGGIWVGTSTGLFVAEPGETNFKEAAFQLESGGQFSYRHLIHNIIQDKNGALIISTEGNGIFFISPVSDEKYSLRNFTLNNSGLGSNIVQCLLIDRSENMWAGTLNGLSKTDLKPKKFRLYQNNNRPNSTPLLGNVIAGLYKSDDGIIWAGNWGQGLNLINTETNEVEHFSSQHSDNHYLPNDFVHVILKDADGNIWLGTRNGIFIYDQVGNRFVLWTAFFNNPILPLFENIRIYDIIQDRKQNFWIASSNGLYKVNLNTSSVEAFHIDAVEENHRLSANSIYSLFEDSEGLIWIATINGLEMYNPQNRQIKHFTKEHHGLSSDFLISLCEDVDGNIWIGSNAYINIFDKKNSRFSYMGPDDGLPSNYIYGIRKDRNNDLWLATGNGLCRYQQKSRKLEVFTLADGLQSPEFNLRASCVCPNGELLFGGMNGINIFFPDSIPGNPYKPELVFTSFTKLRNDVEETVNVENTKKIVLDHHVQSFTINFAALEYTNPENNQYAYKMEGIFNEWREIGNRKFVPFMPSPGEYTFSLIGSNNDGVWNKEEISLQIIVLPPWWRSDYAYLSYYLLLILTVIGFIKLRERRLKFDKIHLEKKVRERTIQINEQNRVITAKNEELNELNRTKDKFFSIIGHDLRNHFNIIIGFSEVLLSGFKKMDGEKQEYHLSNIYRSSIRAHDLLGNLLTWARLQRGAIIFQPEKINVAGKIRELLHFHEEAALKKNILVEVFTEEEIAVNADENMFATIIRNLLANAIKFTENNGEVSIQVKKVNSSCEIVVKDNGVGISAENLEKIFRVDSNVTTPGTCGEKGTGLGLVLCKEFVEKHGGKIRVISERGKGSEFSFTLPFFSA